MRRRRDRGELDATERAFAVGGAIILWGSMAAFAFILARAHDRAHSDLRRIADAVCVEAPPATPVGEAAESEILMDWTCPQCKDNRVTIRWCTVCGYNKPAEEVTDDQGD